MTGTGARRSDLVRLAAAPARVFPLLYPARKYG